MGIQRNQAKKGFHCTCMSTLSGKSLYLYHLHVPKGIACARFGMTLYIHCSSDQNVLVNESYVRQLIITMVAEKVDLPSPAHHRRLEPHPRTIGDWNLTRAPSVIQSPHTIDDWSIARTPSAIGTSPAHHRRLEPRPRTIDDWNRGHFFIFYVMFA